MTENSPNNPIEMSDMRGDLLRINPIGAKISLTIDNHPILVAVARGDGKNGETHPCTPIFGPDRKDLYGLSQHGNMRNELVNVTKDGDSVIVSHHISDAPGRYPSGVMVEQRMTVKDGTFSFDMTHKNEGDSQAPVNSGEHCYFKAPQGYKGTSINGVDVSSLVEETGLIKLLPENVISIPGLPEISLKQKGFSFAVLWVARDEKGVLDDDYICIEPVEQDPFGGFFGSEESMIAPGGFRTSHFELAFLLK